MAKRKKNDSALFWMIAAAAFALFMLTGRTAHSEPDTLLNRYVR